MLTRIAIENFRCFDSLVVEDLGRVNLLVGGNDTGKTSLMEAIGVTLVGDVQHGLVSAHENRFGYRPKELTADLLRLFSHRGDVTRPIRLTTNLGEVVVAIEAGKPSFRAKLDLSFARVWWVRSAPGITEHDVNSIADLKRRGADATLIDALSLFRDDIVGIELIPDEHRIYLRLSSSPFPLPIRAFGDATQRILEFSTGIEPATATFLDELDNGFHVAAYPALWAWLRDRTASVNAQVFGTTHDLDCVASAVRSFVEAGDDGLRIIRLQRAGSTIEAVVYHATEAAEVLEAGLEIR
jgi:AAA domain